MSPAGRSSVTLRSPTDLVAATPYLLGFHPEESLVVLALRERSLVLAARADLPGGGPGADHAPDPAEPARPDRSARPEVTARGLVDTMVRQHATEIAIIGYGPKERVGPAVREVRTGAERRGLVVRDALRVDGGRWWSYVCRDPRCCPPDGSPFDPTTTEVAARLTLEGRMALPDRRELERSVAPVEGRARVAVRRATDRAWRGLRDRLSELPEKAADARMATTGAAAVADAAARYAAGQHLDDEEAARLTVLLRTLPVRDAAWRATDGTQAHQRMWTDLTRRAEPQLVPAPASLLAFAAWRAGNGPLAMVALDRALRADPAYSMARLLQRGLQQGLPPSALEGWGTPEWEERMARRIADAAGTTHVAGTTSASHAGAWTAA